MTWYVEINPVNGRYEFCQLVEKLQSSGAGERIEYFGGGWMDKSVSTISPHLKFEFEDDALAYVLAHGGTVSTEPPQKKPYIDG